MRSYCCFVFFASWVGGAVFASTTTPLWLQPAPPIPTVITYAPISSITMSTIPAPPRRTPYSAPYASSCSDFAVVGGSQHDCANGCLPIDPTVLAVQNISVQNISLSGAAVPTAIITQNGAIDWADNTFYNLVYSVKGRAALSKQCFCDRVVESTQQAYIGINCQTPLTYSVICAVRTISVVDQKEFVYVIPSCGPHSTNCLIVSGFFPWKTCVCGPGWQGTFCNVWNGESVATTVTTAGTTTTANQQTTKTTTVPSLTFPTLPFVNTIRRDIPNTFGTDAVIAKQLVLSYIVSAACALEAARGHWMFVRLLSAVAAALWFAANGAAAADCPYWNCGGPQSFCARITAPTKDYQIRSGYRDKLRAYVFYVTLGGDFDRLSESNLDLQCACVYYEQATSSVYYGLSCNVQNSVRNLGQPGTSCGSYPLQAPYDNCALPVCANGGEFAYYTAFYPYFLCQCLPGWTDFDCSVATTSPPSPPSAAEWSYSNCSEYPVWGGQQYLCPPERCVKLSQNSLLLQIGYTTRYVLPSWNRGSVLGQWNAEPVMDFFSAAHYVNGIGVASLVQCYCSLRAPNDDGAFPPVSQTFASVTQSLYVGVLCRQSVSIDLLCSYSLVNPADNKISAFQRVRQLNEYNTVYEYDASRPLSYYIPSCFRNGTLACAPTPGHYPWRSCICAEGYYGDVCQLIGSAPTNPPLKTTPRPTTPTTRTTRFSLATNNNNNNNNNDDDFTGPSYDVITVNF